MAGSSTVYTSCRPHARAAFLHHPANQAHRGGQPGLLLAAAWRRGGTAAPRASLVAAWTATDEAVYEVVLRQPTLVEDLQGRRAAREAEVGRRRWRDEQLEQEGNAKLGWGLLGDAYDRCGEVSAEYAKTFYLGVIDADYHSPVGVVLFNHSEADFAVKPGDCFAQMIVQVIATPEVAEVEDLDATVRREGGFGSTGV